MRKSRGTLSGQTRKLRKSHKEKGIAPVNKYLQEFAVGDKVHISVFSSEPNGMPSPKFKGKVGVIVGKQGEAYKVEVSDGNAKKILLSRPVHLIKVRK